MLEAKKQEQIEELVMIGLHDNLSVSQREELNHVLGSDQAALEYYLDFVTLCSAIRETTEDQIEEYTLQEQVQKQVDVETLAKHRLSEFLDYSTSQPEETYTPRKPRLKSNYAKSYISSIKAIAACLIVIGCGWVYLQMNQSRSVAKIIDTKQVQWKEPGFIVHQESELQAASYHLLQGTVDIEFHNGASVSFEGPCEFTLTSSSSAFLTAGKLHAHVPPRGVGFTVETPEASIVDLGTDFSVHVDAQGQSDVYVFDGLTKLYSKKSSQNVNVIKGESKRVAINGTITSIPLSEHAYAKQEAEVKNGIKQDETQEGSGASILSPLVGFTFGDDDSLTQSSILPGGHVVSFAGNLDRMNPVLVCQQEKPCLRINDLSDEDWSAGITFSLWIKPEQWVSQNILLHGVLEEDYDMDDMAFYQQLYIESDDAKDSVYIVLKHHPLTVDDEFDEDAVVMRAPVELPADNGVHIAIRRMDEHFSLFINGEALHSVTHKADSINFNIFDTTFLGGSSEIMEDALSLPGFKGVMDDIAIYNRELTHEEIESLYRELQH